jgi:group I intron endonuclease
MSCGIYKIINKTNQKFYVGSSKQIEKRWDSHKGNLRKNTHHNIALQRAWNKYGESNFKFEIEQTLPKTKILLVEQEWLDEWVGSKQCYNIGATASGGDNLTNNPNREKIIEKIRNTLKTQINNMSEDERKEKWGRNGKDNPNWKNGACLFTCPICDKTIKSKGRTFKQTCSSCRDRTGKKNPFFGKTHSEETREKMRQLSINRGNSCNVQKKKIEIDGIVYDSLGDASRALNVVVGTIYHRLNSPNQKFKGYIYL